MAVDRRAARRWTALGGCDTKQVIELPNGTGEHTRTLVSESLPWRPAHLRMCASYLDALRGNRNVNTDPLPSSLLA